MANNYFTICSLFYIVTICIAFFIKERINSTETKIYKYIILTNLFTVITAIICFFTIKNYETIPLINEILSKTLIVLMFTFHILLTAYIYYVSSKNINKNKTDYTLETQFMILVLFSANPTIPPERANESDEMFFIFILLPQFSTVVLPELCEISPPTESDPTIFPPSTKFFIVQLFVLMKKAEFPSLFTYMFFISQY